MAIGEGLYVLFLEHDGEQVTNTRLLGTLEELSAHTEELQSKFQRWETRGCPDREREYGDNLHTLLEGASPVVVAVGKDEKAYWDGVWWAGYDR